MGICTLRDGHTLRGRAIFPRRWPLRIGSQEGVPTTFDSVPESNRLGDSPHPVPVVFLCARLTDLRSTYILGERILCSHIRPGYLPSQSFDTLHLSTRGSGERRQRTPDWWFRVQTLRKTTRRVQILAYFADLFHCLIWYDNEEADCTHDQAQIC